VCVHHGLSGRKGTVIFRILLNLIHLTRCGGIGDCTWAVDFRQLLLRLDTVKLIAN